MKDISRFLFEIGSLRKLPRAHMQTLLTNDLSDNIASHSYRVSAIGYFLAKQEKCDINKVVLMCLFHDVAEARSGDQNWVHKKYVKVYEDEIIKDQLKKLDSDLYKICTEYDERATAEAKVAKDADLIDQILLLKEYEWQGSKEATIWLRDKAEGKKLYSKSAKKLAKEIVGQDPNEWWKNLWTDKRR